MPTVDAKTSGLREPPRPHTDYGVTGSLDRRYYGSFDTDTQAIVRRAQTLRTTDYASRLRERIRTFRPQTVESTATDGGLNLNVTDGRAEGEVSAVGGGLGVRGNVAGDTLKRQTLRPKQEVYVCSESFRIPHKLLKFKRRKTSPPKTVRSSGQEAAENVRPKYESSYDYDQDYSLEAQMEPAVFAKTEGYQHRVPPPVPRAPVQRPHISTNISVSGQPARQLTSLRSAASPTLLQQSTAIPDSASRGMLQMVSVGGDGCATESREVMLPYLSGELSDISKVDLLTGITVDEKVFEATCSDKGPILRDALSKVHPFMKLWMTEESQPETEQAETKEDEINNHRSLMHACLQDYLTACVRLRSVDLQGQYAPFHYPLVTFNERYWKKCAKLSGWGDLTVRCGPEWSTEYLRLPPVDPTRQTLVFPNVPVDTLLINWLNCHQAVVPTPAEPDLKGAMDTVAYHPVEIITTLDRLLEAYDKEKANTDLWHSCLRLAVLLSYNYCLIKYNINTEKHELDTKPANILVTLCTSNCLIIFHKRPANPPPVAKAETEQQSLSSPTADENARSKEKVEGGESGDQTSDTKAGSDKGTESGVKAEEGSPKEEAEVKAEEGEMTTAETKQVESEATETGEKGLLRKISPESKSVEEAIDHEIEKLYQAACSRFSTKNAPSYFFKAIAPPDWMAMVVARVCMKKE
ncbi:unnamed protein product [Calicophoron daubneyi]|uniref:Uncharacterized protein n=1 Tax=Calicophoron daubneyi TaxID=300641 RepID=A0AAV2TZH3_CALDB